MAVFAAVKANKNNKEIKGLLAILTTFYKKYLQNLKYNTKRVCIFSFDFGWYSS